MEVKEAAQMAKEYLIDLFAGEEITNVGLEEVEFDNMSNDWKITIGFSRPWDQNKGFITALGESRPARSYKVIRISDTGSHVVSLKDRLLTASE